MLRIKNIRKEYRTGGLVQKALDGVSLNFRDSEFVAILGPSGCGKTTLLNLILGITDVDEGTIQYQEEDITKLPMEKRDFNIVFQDYALFPNLNVYQNIVYGLRNKPDLSSEEEVNALIDLLELRPHLEKNIEQLSGGQKQRLSIARAICRHPEILIFDDSFSALDYKTDRVLRDTLRKTCADATRFIVAQRIGTIRDADKIIVLDDGKIAGMGKHNELMETCEVYRQIAYSQLSKEELA